MGGWGGGWGGDRVRGDVLREWGDWVEGHGVHVRQWGMYR